MQATAFSPSHISGLFEAFDNPSDPLLAGSRGAGVSLSLGVKTSVKVKNSEKSEVEIRINGKIADDAIVSKNVVQQYQSKTTKNNVAIQIDHIVQVPIGSGFGSSGAGALSLSFAMNEAMETNLSKTEAEQIAHIAEVQNKTGLGTVIAESYGGVEIRTKPGAPGFGKLMKVSVKNDYIVVCLSFGSIFTNSILSDGKKLELINRHGGRLIDHLISQPNVDTFLKDSREFSDYVNFSTKRVQDVLEDSDRNGFTCSMAMIGETVFSIVKKKELQSLIKVLSRHGISEQNLIVSSIDYLGARVL